jgi:hypothetical protein
MVALSAEGTVTLYDPVTMNVRRSANVVGGGGETIYGWIFAGNDTWMIDETATKFYRVSLDTMTVTLAVPSPVLGLAFVSGRLLSIDKTGELRQIDPTTGATIANWQLATPDKQDAGAGVDIFDDGTGSGVWVNQVSTELTHVDLASGQIRTIKGLPYQFEVNPGVLVAADRTMWVSDWDDGLVLRMKP